MASAKKSTIYRWIFLCVVLMASLHAVESRAGDKCYDNGHPQHLFKVCLNIVMYAGDFGPDISVKAYSQSDSRYYKNPALKIYGDSRVIAAQSSSSQYIFIKQLNANTYFSGDPHIYRYKACQNAMENNAKVERCVSW